MSFQKIEYKAIQQHPPRIGGGFPRIYGGSNVFGKWRLPKSVHRRMSRLAHKKRPRLTSPVSSGDGNRKPTCPHVRKCTLLLQNMLSYRLEESRRWGISRNSLPDIVLSIFFFSEHGEAKYTTVTKWRDRTNWQNCHIVHLCRLYHKEEFNIGE